MVQISNIPDTTKVTGVRFRKILGLLILMLIGFYLALSSLISLSYIGDTKTSKLPVIIRFDSLVKSFKTVSSSDQHLVDTLGRLRDSVLRSYTIMRILHDGITNNPRYNRASRQLYTTHNVAIINMLDDQVNLLVNQENAIEQRFNLEEKNRAASISQMEVQFKSNSDQLTAGLLSNYSENVLKYALQQTNNNQLSKWYYQFMSNFLLLSKVIAFQQLHTRMIIPALDAHQPLDSLVDELSAQIQWPTVSNYQIVSDSARALPMPTPQEMGQDWGIVFAPFIRYFAASRNVDVLLLLGMIGFGLFGSAISIYVGGNVQSGETDALHDVMLVIVRGFSAAVVVFLAIRGGVAVINKGESNPDPLVLFLFCFIGAVFSDPIWKWAQKSIQNTFPSGTTNSATGNPPASPTNQSQHSVGKTPQ